MKKISSVLFTVLVLFTLFAAVAAADITKVVNGASFASNNTFAPGTIITIKGNNLAAATASATIPVTPPTTLGGVTVTIGGVPCPLFYVSPQQVNAQIATSVTLGPKTLTLTSSAGTFNTPIEIVAAGSPGIFSMGGTGSRDGAILNAITFAPGPFSVTTDGKPTYLAIYTTGLDLSATPVVTIDGINVLVVYAGNAPGFTGLQQINVQLVSELAGAGRVGVMVKTGTTTTNVVEVMILPATGQGPFAPDEDNKQRSRELSSIAWIPGTSLALLTDENDDVVRVIDLKAKKVIRTITLPEGAEPVAVAVDAAGKFAIVAERERNKVALLDLTAYTVLQEIAVGGGPSAVAMLANYALVLNLDTDTVSIINMTTKLVTGTVAVGRSPRGIAIDPASSQLRAWVTNQNDGSISVIDVANATALAPLQLGANVRPQSILVLPGSGMAIVTEPTGGQNGKALLVNLTNGTIVTELNVNPDKSGGSSEIAIFGTTVYFNNQTGGSVTAAKFVLGPPPVLTPQTIKVGIGARALAIDELDKWLLVTNQGSGEVVLIDLTTNQIVGRINGVRSEGEDDNGKHDNRDDRDKAANMPAITSISPNHAATATSFPLTIIGKNLTGATGVAFINPDDLPGKGIGRGNGNSGNHGHGPFGLVDTAFTVTNVVVNAAGTQLTATVAIAAGAKKGDRSVRVLTPNGESSFVLSSANSFKVD